jgi:glucose-6-phosphate isomerase
MAVHLDSITGALCGDAVTESRRTIADLHGYFLDEAARAAIDQRTLAYRVQSFEPQPEGHPGAVCCATTFLEPGRVGDEYFLTRGHFHAAEDRAELEVTISGTGALVLMTRDRRTWMEAMTPGSVHHVPPGIAHRVANTGETPLVFISYWPSETGHDYRAIADVGFGARVLRVQGVPVLVAENTGSVSPRPSGASEKEVGILVVGQRNDS